LREEKKVVKEKKKFHFLLPSPKCPMVKKLFLRERENERERDKNCFPYLFSTVSIRVFEQA